MNILKLIAALCKVRLCIRVSMASRLNFKAYANLFDEVEVVCAFDCSCCYFC